MKKLNAEQELAARGFIFKKLRSNLKIIKPCCSPWEYKILKSYLKYPFDFENDHEGLQTLERVVVTLSENLDSIEHYLDLSKPNMQSIRFYLSALLSATKKTAINAVNDSVKFLARSKAWGEALNMTAASMQTCQLDAELIEKTLKLELKEIIKEG